MALLSVRMHRLAAVVSIVSSALTFAKMGPGNRALEGGEGACAFERGAIHCASHASQQVVLRVMA